MGERRVVYVLRSDRDPKPQRKRPSSSGTSNRALDEPSLSVTSRGEPGQAISRGPTIDRDASHRSWIRGAAGRSPLLSNGLSAEKLPAKISGKAIQVWKR